ncbi:hypothetical protein KIL84_009564 [Mauremys mutica]|uniref:Uncharacterized protein n=1 Tax=Mauremys mutica TaxID=74926 RepID=A0A9D3XMH2_9SAUR|nr:hypothetical protein KIL84_009564 [Mauremys mutica]
MMPLAIKGRHRRNATAFRRVLHRCSGPSADARQPKRMEDKNLFLALFLCSILLSTAYSHMIFEENRDTNLATSNKMKLPDLPPISIVELTKTSRKVSRKEAEKKKESKAEEQGLTEVRDEEFPHYVSRLCQGPGRKRFELMKGDFSCGKEDSDFSCAILLGRIKLTGIMQRNILLLINYL